MLRLSTHVASSVLRTRRTGMRSVIGAPRADCNVDARVVGSYCAAVLPLRLAIIGAGRHGSRYARHAARDVEGIELVAVCRRDESAGRELAAECGCEYSADAAALCTRDDIDAVAFVTVPWLLEDLISAAAGAGKRLLVEKPVAPDAPTGGRIRDTLDAAGTYCLAGHTLRFNTVLNAVRDRLAELGRIDSIVMSQRFPPQLQIEWLDDPERSGGGNILHTGVHCFDAIRYITGLEPETVACRTAAVYTERTEDNFASLITFEDSDALAMVTCGRSSSARNGLIEISGEKGQLIGDHVHNTLAHITPEGREEIALPPPAHTVRVALEAFVDDARTGGTPRASYRDGLAAVAVAGACYRAARSGKHEPVVLPPETTVV
jgi:predicted dehydrogenase